MVLSVMKICVTRGRWPYTTAAAHCARRKMTAAGRNCTGYPISVITNRCVKKLTFDLTTHVTCIKFSPDGLLLAAGSHGGKLCIWSISKVENIAFVMIHSSTTADARAINSIDFMWNSKCLVVGAGGGL